VQELNRPESRRTRHLRKKKEAILAAATRVFAQKGFACATTRDIADEADMGISTLYDYFDNKRDMLLAIINKDDAPLSAMTQGMNDPATRESMIDLTARSLDYYTACLASTRTTLFEAWLDDQILECSVLPRLRQTSQILQKLLADQVETGAIRPLDPALTARFIMGMFFALMLPALRGIEPFPQPDQRRALAEELITTLLDGISTRQGKSI
jgi:AcrR family transcriptional regulator